MQMTFPFLSKATPSGRLLVWYVLPTACFLWITLFYFQHPSHIPIPNTPTTSYATTTITNSSSGSYKNNTHGVVTVAAAKQPPPTIAPTPDPCAGRYIYVHDLPSRFNRDILEDCRALSRLTDKSRFMSNAGLGPRVGDSGGIFSGSGSWYETDQFALDVIFYHRMKRYACRTSDSSRASSVFVPFFGGLDASRYLAGHNTSVRDAAPRDLVRWLRSRPEWGPMGGRDHFLVAGRPAWDFRRFSDADADWGNRLLLLPEARNMSVLVLESGPSLGNDISIPYPTYFHPSEAGEVLVWQERVRKTERPWLFTFAGAPRSDPRLPGSIRGLIINQCRASRRCRLLDCSSSANDCSSPGSVMGAFQETVFCLQPPGDSFTRRSTFDAMVAGCVPVFFHLGSAYEQYPWHLPRNHSSYSVLIPEGEVTEGRVSIEEKLAGIPEGEVRAMREEVIKAIPRLVYAAPRGRRVEVKDALEVAVEGVVERVGRRRKEMGVEVAVAAAAAAAPPLKERRHGRGDGPHRKGTGRSPLPG